MIILSRLESFGNPLLIFIYPAYNCDMERENMFKAFYAVVQKIPEGKVATYGQVAMLAGYPGYSRQVGYALHSIPNHIKLPWHRVINAKGEISLKKTSPFSNIQREMLESEGVIFDKNGRVSLRQFGWDREIKKFTNED